MKMNTNKVAIERSGVQSESTFRIAASSKAFEILSSGLYKDPILAIIRELSCNAQDAHRAAGKVDEPFEIHLPTRMEPYFYVRDWGTGLSDDDIQGHEVPMVTHEEIHNKDGSVTRRPIPVLDENGKQVTTRTGGLYTTYFDSTKSDSNDDIGAFGLGCKSPFSYTDSYQVTSWYEGTKYVYSLFLNEDRLPHVALMSETPTTEHNGVEVRFAVKSDDFYAFKTKLGNGLRFFNPLPRVSSHSLFSYDDLGDIEFSGEGWTIQRRRGYSGEFVAVMGQVPYRVNFDQMSANLPDSVSNFLRNLHITAFFEIGELEVPPDREEVRYNNKTLKALVTRVTSIRKMFMENIESQVAAMDGESFWNKYQKVAEMSNKLFRDSKELATFVQGQTSNIDLLRYCDAIKKKGLEVPGPLTGHTITKMTNGQRSSSIRLSKGTSTMDYVMNDGEKELSFRTITVVPDNKLLVVYDDLKTGGVARLKDYMEVNNHRYSNVILIKKMTEKNTKNIDWNHDLSKVDHEAEFKTICNSLGNPAVIRLSSHKSVKGSSYQTRPVMTYQFSSTKMRRYDRVIEWDSFELEKDEEAKGGLYYYVERGKNLKDHQGNHVGWTHDFPSNMRAMLDIINASLGCDRYKVEEVIGVAALGLKRLEKKGKWKNVFEVAHGLVDQYQKEVDLVLSLHQTEDVMGIRSILMDGTIAKTTKDKIVTMIDGLDDKSALKAELVRFVEAYKTFDFSREALIMGVAKLNGRVFGKAPTITHYTKGNAHSRLVSTYPMLSFVSNIRYNSAQEFFDYINLVDRSNKV